MDSVPHLLISGQVFLSQTIGTTGLRQLGVQEIKIIDMIKPVTKYAVMVTEPNTIKYHLQKAIHLATTGRPGPVWVDIPANNWKIFSPIFGKTKTRSCSTISPYPTDS